MDNDQREIRRAAAKAFSQSLDQLTMSLETDQAELVQSVEVQPKEKPHRNSDARLNSPISLKDLEEAVADIEQLFMHQQL